MKTMSIWVASATLFLASMGICSCQTVVSLIHLLTYSLVVTLLKSIADCQYAVLLAQYEVSAAVILFAYLCANLFQLLPCAIAESLELSLWVLGSDVLNHVLARVAAVVVWRASQLVLNLRVNQAELVTLRLEWEVLELTAVAVETHQLALLAEY